MQEGTHAATDDATLHTRHQVASHVMQPTQQAVGLPHSLIHGDQKEVSSTLFVKERLLGSKVCIGSRASDTFFYVLFYMSHKAGKPYMKGTAFAACFALPGCAGLLNKVYTQVMCV